jgi:pimeloyl-ACP methyl ester carboxylesterase
MQVQRARRFARLQLSFIVATLLQAGGAFAGPAANVQQRFQDEISGAQPWVSTMDTVRSAETSAQSTTRQCKSGDTLDGVTFSWCADMGKTTDKTKVLYHLHGGGGSEKSLLDSAFYQRLKETWKARNVRPPLVIAVSFGPFWTLTDVPSAHVARHPVLFDFLTRRVIPYLESKNATSNTVNTLDGTIAAAGTTIQTRYLIGSSMGGFNAALLVERRPDLFRKAVLGCPGFFTTVHPFSEPAEIEAYVARTGALRDAVNYGLHVLGADFQGLTLADWERNNPLALASMLTPLSPELLVWYNEADEFGFEEGAAEFASSAALLGARVAAMSNAGMHCRIDPAMESAIFNFLQ